MKDTRWTGSVNRLLWSSALLAVAAAFVTLLSPGGLGSADPVRVETGPSADVYRWVHEILGEAPSWLDVASDVSLVLIGLAFVLVGWSALRRRDAYGVAGTAVTGAGTVAAYTISEGVKLVVDEERPCRVLVAIPDCPPLGDWSFPSNHATLAAGLAAGLVVLRPRLAALAVPMGVVAALLRVLAGAHYPHDVLAGMILGGCVAVAAWLLLTPVAARLASPLLVKTTRFARPGSGDGHAPTPDHRGAAQPGSGGFPGMGDDRTSGPWR